MLCCRFEMLALHSCRVGCMCVSTYRSWSSRQTIYVPPHVYHRARHGTTARPAAGTTELRCWPRSHTGTVRRLHVNTVVYLLSFVFLQGARPSPNMCFSFSELWFASVCWAPGCIAAVLSAEYCVSLEADSVSTLWPALSLQLANSPKALVPAHLC